mgnify:CR=1 FL=1|jgi:hypothetical protein
MITATWRTKRFTVDANRILSFKSMTLSSGVELEEKISGNTAYQEKSSESPAELSLDVHISSLLGNDPKAELDSWIKLSRDGVAGRFYVGKRDFLGCTLILTNCEAKDIQLAPNGELKSCNLSLTFEQASGRWTSESAQESMVSGGGSGGRKSGGSKKANTLSAAARAKAAAKNASKQGKEKVASNLLNTIKSGISKIKNTVIKAAKEASKVSAVTKKATTPNTINAYRKTNSVKTQPAKTTVNKVNKVNKTKTPSKPKLTNVFRKTK